jgi:hypothetical protein
MNHAEHLSTTIEQLREAAATGTLVDLAGLLPEIERLCSAAKTAEDSRKAAEELHILATAIDTLHGELARVEEATRKAAAEAYSR